MICYSNTTTARLEGYARARGLTLGIAITPDNTGGRYHVVNEDAQPLTHWWGLGWTVAEAQDRIDEVVALRAARVIGRERDERWLDN